MADSMEPCKKCCAPTLVAMATKFGLGAEIQTPTGLLHCNMLSKLPWNDVKSHTNTHTHHTYETTGRQLMNKSKKLYTQLEISVRSTSVFGK